MYFATNGWSGRLYLPCNSVRARVYWNGKNVVVFYKCVCLPACLPGCLGGGDAFPGEDSFIILFAVKGYKQDLCFQMTFTQLVTYSETLICLWIFEHQCQNDSGNAQHQVMGKFCESSRSSKWKLLSDAFWALAWIFQNLMCLKWCYLCCCSASFGVKCNPENGFKISYFVKFSIFLEPPRFLHLFLFLFMRRGTQTYFFLNSDAFLFCLDLINWNNFTCLKKALKQK